MLALSVIGLLPGVARASGEIMLGGENLLTLSEREMCAVRGQRIGMIFQEPMTALNPAQRVGTQIAEGMIVHDGLTRAEARAKAIELLERVHVPQASQRVDAFPA